MTDRSSRQVEVCWKHEEAISISISLFSKILRQEPSDGSGPHREVRSAGLALHRGLVSYSFDGDEIKSRLPTRRS
jgi:hypothetical protein